MSLLRLVVITLASLLFLAGFAVAGDEDHPDYPDHKDHDKDHDKDHKDKICAPKCIDKKWEWTYNSIHQNPCKIAAHLLSTCHQGSYSLEPLAPGASYGFASECDLCECNTVVYSLISACEACQGGKYPYFKEYIKKCPKVLRPGHFPYPVPYGTKVPKWAFIDVTDKDAWDPAQAAAVGGVPEADPGTDLA